MEECNIACLPVMKQGMLVGILTAKDILKSHPNRIAADAMNRKIISVSSKTSLWKAKQLLEESNMERLLVVDEGKLVGSVTQAELFFELGKYIDILTGLYKSDYIYHRGMELLSNGCEISMIFLDINKFGLIDKEFGHIHGNIILKELSMLLKNHTSPDTYLCRFGGDEFIVLTPYKTEKCKLLAENLIRMIDGHIFSNQLTVTVAVGISGGRRQEERRAVVVDTISDLINLASLASTQAKKNKQNLVLADGFCGSEGIASA